jgi:formamidopyrimidine-DNA glycosylase
MPELPEVAALASHLTGLAAGRRLVSAELAAVSVLKTFDPPLSSSVDRLVVDVQRRGKFLCWQLDPSLWLVMHLARAGWLRWYDAAPAKAAGPGRGPLMLRLVFVDGDGQVAGRCDMTEAGTRKSSALYVVPDPLAVPGIARLGPDPMDASFTEEVFAQILGNAGRAQIKGVLRDQSIIAGIGNAYSDEILHAAKMSPFKPATSLTEAERSTLYRQTRVLLEDAVQRASAADMRALKDDKRTHLRVHGRTGAPCPVCGDTIREVSFADSALQYCPTCQTGGKPLADRRLSRLLK